METERPRNVINFKESVRILKKRQVRKRVNFDLHRTVKLHAFLSDRLGDEHELTSTFMPPKSLKPRFDLLVTRRGIDQIARMLLDEQDANVRKSVGESLIGLDYAFTGVSGYPWGNVAYEAFIAEHYEDISRQEALDIVQ
ncbi:MAG: hypothetical protein AAB512_00705 [Patescibacteria group bacterium]